MANATQAPAPPTTADILIGVLGVRPGSEDTFREATRRARRLPLAALDPSDYAELCAQLTVLSRAVRIHRSLSAAPESSRPDIAAALDSIRPAIEEAAAFLAAVGRPVPSANPGETDRD